uniref:PIN domain-containing protein n=1 Tax=Candidatus Kentrum sp. TC TaxID=2126339 RepID=A0A450ZSK1_9GAMM|nr:MAG: hypothetical protein BECKTC1821F_GA0114240_101217 [Candidatus Kentron sp. TC]
MTEVARGDPSAAAERLKSLETIPEIEITEQAAIIAEKLLLEASLPGKARVDALHIAVAAIGGMDYLLTWNCTHIANPSFVFSDMNHQLFVRRKNCWRYENGYQHYHRRYPQNS